MKDLNEYFLLVERDADTGLIRRPIRLHWTRERAQQDLDLIVEFAPKTLLDIISIKVTR